MKHLHGLIIILSMLIVYPVLGNAQTRYPSSDPTISEPKITNNPTDVVCQCDPTNDPCCNPTVGTVSDKTEDEVGKRTDTSTCKCDPVKDPCCKKMEGTK